MDRLNAQTLARTRAHDGVLRLPPRGWESQSTGIVHLGLGAFHRAHQASYTQDWFRLSGDDRWGICGVTQRSATVKAQLGPQDGLYGLLDVGPTSRGLTIVGSLREILFPAEEHDALMARFASRDVSVVSLTVTEKGYSTSAVGRLDLSNTAVATELVTDVPTTAVGRLVAGLRHRADEVDAPITVISCDNVPSNGAILRALVMDFCAARSEDDLARWIDRNVSFPSTMVDRIVPATTSEDRARAAEILGAWDEGLVVAESYRQWVLEDAFIAARPEWESVGAQIVPDVAPFEQMKLRVLNGTHSALAYLGALKGHRTIASAVADPQLRDFAAAMIEQDVLPTLTRTETMDPAAYAESVLVRFANPNLAHTTTQVAMDGSAKLPVRLIPTLVDSRRAGRVPTYVVTAIAGWMVYVLRANEAHSLPVPLDDPLADVLTGALGSASRPRDVVDALLPLGQIFPANVSTDPTIRSALIEAVAELSNHLQ